MQINLQILTEKVKILTWKK